MKKKNKSAYTYPKLAEHLRELFAKGEPYGWGGLQGHMEQSLPKTIEEMVANKELIIQDNLIQLPVLSYLSKIYTKDMTTKKQHTSGCKKVIHQPAPQNEDKPKRHEGG